MIDRGGLCSEQAGLLASAKLLEERRAVGAEEVYIAGMVRGKLVGDCGVRGSALASVRTD